MNYYYYVCYAFICNLRIFITWSANWCWCSLDRKVFTFIIKHKRSFCWQVNVKFYCCSPIYLILDAWGQIVSTAFWNSLFIMIFPWWPMIDRNYFENIFAGWYLVCKIVMVFFFRSCHQAQIFQYTYFGNIRSTHFICYC